MKSRRRAEGLRLAPDRPWPSLRLWPVAAREPTDDGEPWTLDSNNWQLGKDLLPSRS